MNKYLIFFLTAIVVGCNSAPIDLPNFDEAKWIGDPHGCKGIRLDQVENLQANLEQLKGMNQNEIDALLGKPDQHELYKRSQKFFYYQISPGEACDITDPRNIHLSIRFNATGLAKEVIIMNREE